MSGTEIVKHEQALTPEIVPAYSLEDIEFISHRVSKAQAFPGFNSPEAVFSLMLICQSDGLHPIHAVRRYHFMRDGRPAMRADAMHAEFQKRGGRIKWVHRDDSKVEALFSHPIHAPEPVSIVWTIEQARKAGLVRDGSTWTKQPRSMLSARVVTEGVRLIDPGVIVGIMSVEEAEDMAPPEIVYPTFVAPSVPAPPPPPPPVAAAARESIKLLSQTVDPDPRPWHKAAAEELAHYVGVADAEGLALAVDQHQLHRGVLRDLIKAGRVESPGGKLSQTEVLNKLQSLHRDPEARAAVREALVLYLGSKLDALRYPPEDDAPAEIEAPAAEPPRQREPGEDA